MLLATGALGRWGYRLRKDVLGHLALMVAGFAFAALGILSYSFQARHVRIEAPIPPADLGLILSVVGLSFLLGLTMSSANILAQTIVQEETPTPLRGRVFAVQYMLNNLVGIPPMLAIGGLADWLGIPPVLIGVAGAILLATGMSAYVRYGRPSAEWLRPPLRSDMEGEERSEQD